MIGTATNRLTFPTPASAMPAHVARVRRRVSPQSGRALEKLGHAIEYLADEYMNEEGAPPFSRDGRLEAIEVLMAVNRAVYSDCPEIPTLGERLRQLIHRFV